MSSKVPFLIQYVGNPTLSAGFYEKVLGRPPVEASPNFVMFALDGGSMLGLWARAGVEPAVVAAPGGNETAFTVESPEAVDQTYRDWASKGVPMAQTPCALDFGYTFVATDPDGHRLRVFSPSA